MITRINVSSVLLGIVLGAATVFWIGAANGKAGPTYEYKFLYQTVAQPRDIESAINEAAPEGWEVVAYAIDSGNRHALLKRIKR